MYTHADDLHVSVCRGAASAKEEAAVGTAKPRHKSRARAGMCPVRHSGQRSSVFKAM